MDFKVCGTAKGITALQMDNKARGLSVDILARALKQASEGRAYILDAMLETIAAPREELSEFAPRIETIHIPAIEGPAGEAAKAMILGIVKEPEVGETFDGEVVGIKDFGAFVKLTPGKDGLLHISRVANGRVGKVEDVLNLGDIIKVEVLEVDPKTGKISLDRLDKPDAPESSASNGERRERGDRNGGRDNRPGRSGREGNGGGNRTPRRRHDA